MLCSCDLVLTMRRRNCISTASKPNKAVTLIHTAYGVSSCSASSAAAAPGRCNNRFGNGEPQATGCIECILHSEAGSLHQMPTPTIERLPVNSLTPQRLWDDFVSSRKPVSEPCSASCSAACMGRRRDHGVTAGRAGRHRRPPARPGLESKPAVDGRIPQTHSGRHS